MIHDDGKRMFLLLKLFSSTKLDERIISFPITDSTDKKKFLHATVMATDAMCRVRNPALPLLQASLGRSAI